LLDRAGTQLESTPKRPFCRRDLPNGLLGWFGLPQITFHALRHGPRRFCWQRPSRPPWPCGPWGTPRRESDRFSCGLFISSSCHPGRAQLLHRDRKALSRSVPSGALRSKTTSNCVPDVNGAPRWTSKWNSPAPPGDVVRLPVGSGPIFLVQTPSGLRSTDRVIVNVIEGEVSRTSIVPWTWNVPWSWAVGATVTSPIPDPLKAVICPCAPVGSACAADAVTVKRRGARACPSPARTRMLHCGSPWSPSFGHLVPGR
jgi:hypothetical protein